MRPTNSDGGMRPTKIDPKDRARLNEHPVSIPRVLAMFKPYSATLAIVVGLIMATSLISIAQPFLVRNVVDDAIPNQNVKLLLILVGSMIAVTVVTQVFGVIQTWLSAKVGQQVMHRIRSDVFANLQRQSLGFFTRTRAGEIQSRLVNDVAGMKGVLTSTATSIATNVTTAVATAIAMVALSPTLSLLSLIVLPPSIWLTRKVALARRDITAEQQATLAKMQANINESLSVSGIRLTKTLGTGESQASAFEDISHSLISLELRSQMAGRWRMATMQIIFAIIPALVYLIAGLPATSNGMTIGTLIAFSTLQAGIFRPLMGLLNVGAQWVTSMALFSRIFEYLDLTPDLVEPSSPTPIGPVRGDVTFESVRFAYQGADENALTDVDLTIPSGSTVAIVGATGSGKSTMASLLTRLVDPSAGRVTIDGVDLRDISAADRAANIGIVSQETFMLHASVRDNLLMARPGATEFQLWEALEVAEISDLIHRLPDGLDTVVGERGFRFSGGELQRIAIARTVLRNPAILVLDEATSALDNETERKVQAGIDRLAEGRTTMVIAHRLSTIRDADQIVVLDRGQIIERGTYEELVARGGAFAQLALREDLTRAA